MSSETWGVLVVAVIGHSVDDPLFYSTLLRTFVYVMIILISGHAKTGTPGGEWGRGDMITQISCFFKHYNGLLVHFITSYCILLACFPVVIVYIPVQKVVFLIFTYNQKLCGKHVDPVTKSTKSLKLIPNKKLARVGGRFSLLRWYQQLQYHWWVDADTIFRYPKAFFDIPKLD